MLFALAKLSKQLDFSTAYSPTTATTMEAVRNNETVRTSCENNRLSMFINYVYGDGTLRNTNENAF